MAAVSISAVIVFAIVLCIVEVPKMRREKQIKELWMFSIILGLGVLIAIMKSLDMKISNPSDWVAWIYSPLKGLLENLTK
jgi:hypothetical protein